MNRQAENRSSSGITITPEAAQEIQRIRLENKIPDTHALRIDIKNGGCCGSSYVLGFNDKSEETDTVFQTEGVKVIIDTQSLAQLSGATLEFVGDEMGCTFQLDNPNEQKSCNCDDGCCG